MIVQDIGIYYPDHLDRLFHHHITKSFGPIHRQWSYYTTADAFLNSTHKRKVACLQIPYPFDKKIEQEIDNIYDSVDTIAIIGTELHPDTVDFMRRYDRSKMRWFICGQLNPPLNQGRTYQFLDWFITTVHFYKNVRPSTLYSLNPHDPKPYVFDALLGRKKLHRDRCYNFIQKENLESQGVITYMNTHDATFNSKSSDSWVWEDQGLTGQERVQWTVDLIDYYGYKMSLSQVIPLNVYNQTAYSLVCETNCDNDYVFFTEKTVKPILARRLFVLVANRYSLAMLRELGFQTFSNIIDESYDEMASIYNRQKAALAQLKWLCEQDQTKILNQCRDIVEHNFNLMYSRDWYQDFADPFKRTIDDNPNFGV
jgi:hypothetical protein